MKFDVLTLCLLVAGAAHAAWDGAPVSAKDTPSELKRFIEPQTVLLSFERGDLDGDGLADYVVVLEKQKRRPSDEDIAEGQRPLLLILRQTDGSLKVAKRNENMVFCSTCGGVFGDPLESIEVGPKTFTVKHYGGSGWRWHNSFRFNYSRRDNTWQLVRAEDVSFHAGDPDKTTTTKIYTPPRHFGKIDIADFNPQKFLGEGAK